MKKIIEIKLEDIQTKMLFIERSDKMFCINIDWIVLNSKRQVLTELLQFSGKKS